MNHIFGEGFSDTSHSDQKELNISLIPLLCLLHAFKYIPDSILDSKAFPELQVHILVLFVTLLTETVAGT